jgi:hypothetical protein
MFLSDLIEGLILVSMIGALLVLGFGLILRSGVINLSAGQGMRQMAANLSQALLMLAVCIFGLAVIQQAIGFRMALFWQ